MTTRVLLTIACLVLVGVSPAAARVVPQQSIKGVSLTMTVAEVRDVLGPPNSVIFERNEIMGRTRVYKYGLTYIVFGGAGEDATVVSLSTRSRHERTRRGVGVGSTRRVVSQRVPGARCRVEFGVDHCYVGSFRPGTRVTDFRIGSRGRVRQVVVGFVID